MAAFNIGAEFRPAHPKGPEPQPSFHIAYIARAITVGSFAMPAAHAEDMYAPAITARTAMGDADDERAVFVNGLAAGWPVSGC